MKLLGIFLIIAGIAMFIIRSFSYTQEKNVVNLGPVEINKRENKTVTWPLYAAGIVTLAGVGVLLMAKKD
jgi:hypothetical protein